MGKKSKPPPAPDYAALAKQTAEDQRAQLALQTKENRPNQNSPWGSVQWTQNPKTKAWTQNVSLNPADQAQLDANRGIQKGMTDTAGGLLGQAQTSLQTPLSTEGLPSWQNLDYSQLPQGGNANALPTGGMQGSVNAPGMGGLPAAGDASKLQGGAYTGLGNAGSITDKLRQTDPIQGQVQGGGQLGQLEGGTVGSYGQQGKLGDYGQAGQVQGFKNYGQMGSLAPSLGEAGADIYGKTGSIKGDGYGGGQIDYSKLGDFGTLDYSNQDQLNAGFGAVKEVQDAMNALNAPGREQARQGEIQRLKSQGITENSPAWTRAMQRLETGDMEAANRSLLAATGEYGNVFNRGLAYNQQKAGLSQSQADLLDRQRGMRLSEQATQGGFDEGRANRSMQSSIAGAQLDSQNQAQMFQQALQRAGFQDQQRGQNMQMDLAGTGFNNAAQAQNFSQGLQGANYMDQQRGQNQQMDLANAGFQSQNQAQQFGQNLAQGNFANQAQQQQFGQNLAGAQFGNEAQNQRFGQNLQAGQFANQGYNQLFNQSMSGQQFQNQLRQQGQSEQQQGFNQALAGAQFGNQAQQQGFNQSLQQQQLAAQLRGQGLNEMSQASGLNSQQRAAMLNEQQMLRQNPLNDLRSLMGASPTHPAFQGFNAAGQGQGVDYMGAGNAQYQAQMDAFNAKQAQSGNMMSGLFGLGGAALGAPGFWGP